MLAPATPPSKVLKAVAATQRRETLLRMARAQWPALMLAAVVGVLGHGIGLLPGFVISLLAAGIWIGICWLTWRGWKAFEPETDQAAIARLEHFHNLSDMAPLSGMGDRPAAGDASLWQWQRTRAFALLPALAKPVPWPVRRSDGLKLVALLAVGGLALAFPQQALTGFRFDLSPLVGDRPIVSELTATPPDYTGAPAIELDPSGGAVTVPAGTVLTVRVDGPGGAPRLKLPGKDVMLVSRAGGGWHGQVRLDRSGEVSVHRFGGRGSWKVTIVPDTAPVLGPEVTLQAASQGRVQVGFSASDDYGVTTARLLLVPVQPIEGLPESKIPPLEIPLPARRDAIGAADGEAGEALNLFAEAQRHPLAGLAVRATLVIGDASGQTASSQPVELVLPEFSPRTPLAAAMLEIRTLLLREARPYAVTPPQTVTVLDPENGEAVRLDVADRLVNAPPGIKTAEQKLAALHRSFDLLGADPTSTAGLVLVLSTIRAARSVAEAQAIEADLWALAMRFNGTAGTPAQQRIAEAREALKDALENNASASEIEERMDELRAAVGERLAELAQEQGSEPGDMEIEQPGGESLSPSDLADMLDALEQSGAGGDSQSALQQLADLDQLLENLQSGGQSGGEGSGEGGIGQASGEGQGRGQAGGDGSGGGSGLEQALREQERLSDETISRDARADEQGREPDNLNELAGDQGALAQRLRAMGEGEAGQGQGSPAQAAGQAREDAARAMEDAAEALARNDADAARAAQRRATQALRNARRLADQSSGQQGRQGSTSGGSRDPLGRPSEDFSEGSDTKVPDQIERRQARDIRDLLRRRQAEPGRSEDERGYIERLLDGL
jgi:hypothetical protein